jgi:DNA-damage-inducible protein D
MACESTGQDPDNHIRRAPKKVSIGSGAVRQREDFFVSRFGAYLIAMNGSPQLPQVAEAQRYFAVQTRRQELSEQFLDVEKRVALRARVRDANKHLRDAAYECGVQRWALFHDAGYRGLYEMGLSEIKGRKEIGEKEELLDRAGRAELAANEFRITQTEEVLRRDNIQGDQSAREAHRRVGAKVRQTIRELGGTMPEDLPAEQSIKKLANMRRKQRRIAKN